MADNVSGGELITGILKGADLASVVTNAMNATQDIGMAKDELKGLKADLTYNLEQLQELGKLCTKDGYHILQQAILDLGNYLPTLFDDTWNIALASRQGLQATATIKNTRAKLYATQYRLDLNQKLAWGLPETILTEKVQEWYLNAYRPSNPSEQLTIEQYVRGHLTATQAAHYLAIKGVPDELAFMLYDHYEKYPSVRELALASEFTAITDDQLREAMKYDNITLPDNTEFYLNYAHAIQLRAEFNQYIVQLKTDYINGLMTEVEFVAEIAAHKPNATEAAQIVENANKAKVRYLVNMEVQSITWLYRKGTLGDIATDGEAEETFYTSLIAISMDEATANALVRFEACKQGYNWEHE